MMIKTKKLKNYIYEGLGFPINLKDVIMVYVEDEWLPQIDVKKVAIAVMSELVFQKEKYTGNQLRFIRTYFEKSLRDFSTIVRVSHNAVAKWERFTDNTTNMDVNIEILLRLYIYEKVLLKNKKSEQFFYKKFVEIRELDYLEIPPTPIAI